ncbi:hypothetical protein KKF55_00925 [Patescibacteria group bacterium]|nr:hypothetical protein [Patescibacteria group bacterium]
MSLGSAEFDTVVAQIEAEIEAESDPHIKSGLQRSFELQKEFGGQYVAFLDEEVIAHNSDARKVYEVIDPMSQDVRRKIILDFVSSMLDPSIE